MVALGRGNIERLSGLHRVLSWSSGFSLSVVIVEDQATRREILEWIQRWSLNDGGPPILDLQHISGTRIIPELHRMRAEVGGPFGLVLWGLEATTVSEFVELNVHREELPSILGGPMIIIASTDAARALVEDAPDLYSWRGYTVSIEGHARTTSDAPSGSSGTEFSALISFDQGTFAEDRPGDSITAADGFIGPWGLFARARAAWLSGARAGLADLVEATKIFAEVRDQRGLFNAAGLLATIYKNCLKFELARSTLAQARGLLVDDIQKAVLDLVDASVLLHLSNHIEAEERIRSALTLLAGEGLLPDEQALAHGLLAQIATRRGHVDAASSHLKDAYRLSTQGRKVSLDLQHAILHLRRGRLSRAERILSKIRGAERVPFWQQIECTLTLCESFVRRHHWSHAETLLQELVSSRWCWAGTMHEISVSRIRGEIALGSKDFGAALLHFESARQIAASADAVDARTQGALELGVARALLLGGRIHDAAALATEAYRRLTRGDDVTMKAECELVLGRIYRALGRGRLARAFFVKALVGFGKLGDTLGEAECDDQLGNLMLLEQIPLSSDVDLDGAGFDVLGAAGGHPADLQTLENVDTGESLHELDLGAPTPRLRDPETVRSLFESALRHYKEAQRFSEGARVADSLASIAPEEEIRRYYVEEARRLWRLAGRDDLAEMFGNK